MLGFSIATTNFFQKNEFLLALVCISTTFTPHGLPKAS
jgi:hypothetical protein